MLSQGLGASRFSDKVLRNIAVVLASTNSCNDLTSDVCRENVKRMCVCSLPPSALHEESACVFDRGREGDTEG